jgi:site-specific DNA-cytosine methylase
MVAVGSLCARTGQSISVQDTAQGHLMPTWPADISSTLDTTFGTKQGLEDQHVNAGCPMFVPAEMSTVQTLRAKRPGEGGMSHDHEHIVSVLSPALNTCSGANHAPDTKAYVVQPIALAENTIGRKPENGGNVMNVEHDMVGTLQRETHGHEPIVMQQMAVRRLTPVECERLQGFPDTYTDIKSKGKATPDGPRYKALGNSMAVPVMAWIGKRINEVESLGTLSRQEEAKGETK